MKRFTQLLTVLALMLPLTVSAQTTTTRTVTWAAPTVDATHTAAASYIFQWRTVGAAGWTTATGSVTSPSISLDIPVSTPVEARVAAVDALGRQGPWSLTSDPYTYATPGACSKPVWQ